MNFLLMSSTDNSVRVHFFARDTNLLYPDFFPFNVLTFILPTPFLFSWQFLQEATAVENPPKNSNRISRRKLIKIRQAVV